MQSGGFQDADEMQLTMDAVSMLEGELSGQELKFEFQSAFGRALPLEVLASSGIRKGAVI
jgi:hypothetical protein